MAVRRVLLVLAAVLVLPVAVEWPAPAPAVAAGPPVTLIGDSVMASLNYGSDIDTVRAKYTATLDAAVCRRLVNTSCTYDGVRPSTAMQILAARAGQLGQAVVMMVGYNDEPLGPSAEQVMAELDRQNVPVVVWMTYLSPGGRFNASNAQLAAAAANHPRVKIADWNNHAASHPGWTASDGLHLTAAGRAGLAAFITAQLDAYLAPGAAPCGAQPAAPLPGPSQPQAPSTAGRYVAVDPVRILDTRSGVGVDAAGRRARHQAVPLRFPPESVPAGAVGAVVTVTVTQPCEPGFVTAYPCAAGVPTASNLNFTRDQTVPNLVVVSLDAGGKGCLYTSAETHLITDLAGWIGPTGSGFLARTPSRVYDTRSGLGGRNAPLAAGESVTVALGVPLDTTSSVVNVTAADPAADGYLTVHPCGSAPGETSNVNYTRGESAGALAVAELDAGGNLCLASSAPTDVIIDRAGEFTGAEGRSATLITPTRVLDTRATAALQPGKTVSLPLPAPIGATAAIVNLTVTQPAAAGFVTAHPCDQDDPPTSSLNFQAGDTVPNLAVVRLSEGSTLCVTASTRTHVVADLSGWVSEEARTSRWLALRRRFTTAWHRVPRG